MGLSGGTISFTSAEISGLLSKSLPSGNFSESERECVLAMMAETALEKHCCSEEWVEGAWKLFVLTM